MIEHYIDVKVRAHGYSVRILHRIIGKVPNCDEDAKYLCGHLTDYVGQLPFTYSPAKVAASVGTWYKQRCKDPYFSVQVRKIVDFSAEYGVVLNYVPDMDEEVIDTEEVVDERDKV